jgi:hypothetical protein
MPFYPWTIAKQGARPNSFSFYCCHFWTCSWVHQGAWGCVTKIMSNNVVKDNIIFHPIPWYELNLVKYNMYQGRQTEKHVPWSFGDATSINGALVVFAPLMSCLESPFTPTYIHTKCITSQRHMIKSNKIVGFPKELKMHMQLISISLIIHYLWQYLPKHSKAKQGFEW